MKKQIIHISPLQAAKILALLYFFISLPLLLLMLAMPGTRPPFMSGFMIMMPFIYALFGFLFTLYGTWIYNFVASRIGGIELTTRDIDSA